MILFLTYGAMHTVYQIKYIIHSVNMSWLHLSRLNNEFYNSAHVTANVDTECQCNTVSCIRPMTILVRHTIIAIFGS